MDCRPHIGQEVHGILAAIWSDCYFWQAAHVNCRNAPNVDFGSPSPRTDVYHRRHIRRFDVDWKKRYPFGIRRWWVCREVAIMGKMKTAVTQATRPDNKSDLIEPFMEFSSCNLYRRGSPTVQFRIDSSGEVERPVAFMAFLAAIRPPERE